MNKIFYIKAYRRRFNNAIKITLIVLLTAYFNKSLA